MNPGDTIYLVEAGFRAWNLHDRNPVVEAQLVSAALNACQVLVDGRQRLVERPFVYPTRAEATAEALRLFDAELRTLQAQTNILQGRKALFQELYS